LIWWVAYVGLLLLASRPLLRVGAQQRLMAADPPHLALEILIFFFCCSLWVGQRA